MEKTERRKNMSTQILLKSGLKVTGNRPKKTPLFMAIAALLLVVAMVLSGCQPKTHSEEVIAAVKKPLTTRPLKARQICHLIWLTKL